jgi:hypothetical protein
VFTSKIKALAAKIFLKNTSSKSWRPGLRDGFFSNEKSKFGQILEGLRWENVDIF